MKKLYNVTMVNGDTAKKVKVVANSKRDKVISNVAGKGDEIVKIEDVTPDIDVIKEKINNADIFTDEEKEILTESL